MEEALEKGAFKEHLDELGPKETKNLDGRASLVVGDEVYVQRNLFWMAAVVAEKGPVFFGGISAFGMDRLFWTTGNVPTTRFPRNSR